MKSFQIKRIYSNRCSKNCFQNRKEHFNGDGFKVALLDLGTKNNIIRSLEKRGCDVTVYPADTTAEEILGDQPDGIMLSNGPGDPKRMCTDHQRDQEII